jgi:hypothetical protein
VPASISSGRPQVDRPIPKYVGLPRPVVTLAVLLKVACQDDDLRVVQLPEQAQHAMALDIVPAIIRDAPGDQLGDVSPALLRECSRSLVCPFLEQRHILGLVQPRSQRGLLNWGEAFCQVTKPVLDPLLALPGTTSVISSAIKEPA